jgi:YggT family protein
VQDTAIHFVLALTWTYTILVIVYIILSWVQVPYSVWYGRFRTFLHDTVEPYLSLFRRMIPPVGGFDLSPVIGLVLLNVASQIVIAIISAG